MFIRASMLALLLAMGMLTAASATDPLLREIQKGDINAVKRLLDRGASSNARDADGTPALMVATLYNDADGVKLLPDHGADPNASNAAGTTALMCAITALTTASVVVDPGAHGTASPTTH